MPASKPGTQAAKRAEGRASARGAASRSPATSLHTPFPHLLHDHAPVHQRDLVRVHDGGQPVRDNDAGAAAHELVQGELHHLQPANISEPEKVKASDLNTMDYQRQRGRCALAPAWAAPGRRRCCQAALQPRAATPRLRRTWWATALTFSECTSRADVASSRSKSLGSFKHARAMATRCFCTREAGAGRPSGSSRAESSWLPHDATTRLPLPPSPLLQAPAAPGSSLTWPPLSCTPRSPTSVV